jgi:AcrR family transcriptional regulator
MTSGLTERDRAKAGRQTALLHEAARLFAERGFTGVSLEDLGAAVGVSGPAVYRHFANKQALLGAILLRVSERLRDGGLAVLETTSDPAEQLAALVRFQVDFALADADVIRVQDRDLASLSDDDRHRVRRLQREYVDVWVDVLGRLHPARGEGDLRVRAHACFGLINSTPHSVRGLRGAPADSTVRGILESMAVATLSV